MIFKQYIVATILLLHRRGCGIFSLGVRFSLGQAADTSINTTEIMVVVRSERKPKFAATVIANSTSFRTDSTATTIDALKSISAKMTSTDCLICSASRVAMTPEEPASTQERSSNSALATISYSMQKNTQPISTNNEPLIVQTTTTLEQTKQIPSASPTLDTPKIRLDLTTRDKTQHTLSTAPVIEPKISSPAISSDSTISSVLWPSESISGQQPPTRTSNPREHTPSTRTAVPKGTIDGSENTTGESTIATTVSTTSPLLTFSNSLSSGSSASPSSRTQLALTIPSSITNPPNESLTTNVPQHLFGTQLFSPDTDFNLDSESETLALGPQTPTKEQAISPSSLSNTIILTASASTPKSTPQVVVIDGESITANSNGGFVISTQTLFPGGLITESGKILVLAAQQTSVPIEPVLMLGTSSFTRSRGVFVISGQTLRPGGAITANSQAISLSPTGDAVILNGVLTVTTFSTLRSILPNEDDSSAVIGTQTLIAGGRITVGADILSLAPSGLGIVVVSTASVSGGQSTVFVGAIKKSSAERSFSSLMPSTTIIFLLFLFSRFLLQN